MLSHTAMCLRLCSLMQSYGEDEIIESLGLCMWIMCFHTSMYKGDVMSCNGRLLLAVIGGHLAILLSF